MPNKIDQLQTEVDSITNSLKELKDNVTLRELEKKDQAEKLSSQAESTKKIIENEIKALERATDEESKKKKAQAESLLDSLSTVTDYYNSIKNNQPSTTETLVQKETDDRNIFTKATDWVGEQWNDVWTKEKWETEGGKNLLRTAGFVATGVGAVSLAYTGLKKLFGWGENEEDEDEDEKEEKKSKKKKKKKKSFWKRPFGRFLKRTGIGTAIVGGIYGIGKYFGLIGKGDNADGRSSDEDKLNGYEREIVNNPENQEKLENYESFGKQIDILYESIYNSELKAGYEDELEMKKIATEQSNGEKFYKGIVPFCLDNQFKSVENILGQNSSMKEAIANHLQGMINYIKGKGNDFLQLFVDSYLDKLPSWLPFKNAAGSLSDRIDQWKVKNENAEQEMQYFFRQSIRVQTYLFEKRDHLIEKIVKEASVKYGVSEKDILGNDENFKKYVTSNPNYQNFINSPIHSAVTVLKNYNIFDSEIREKMKENVEELDKQRKKVLSCNEGEKDILEIIKEKQEKGENLTEQEEKLLEKACDGIIEDIDDNILEAVEESAWSIYGDLLGTNDSHLREYLDKSGLDKVFREYKQIILQKKSELKDGNLNNDNKASLAESINNMLALKKEAILGSKTIEKDYDENGNIIYRIPGFFVGSVNNLCTSVTKLRHGDLPSGINYMTSAGLGTGLIITSAGSIYGIKTGKWGVAKLGAKITVLPVGVSYEGLTMIKPLRDGVDKVNYPFKFWGENGPKKLMDLLKDGKISLNKASEIAKGKALAKLGSAKVERRRKDFFGITNNNENVTYKLFDKLVTNISDTAAGSTYLQSIKDDHELYETLVKKYDSSKEIRQAISQNVSIEELKKAINKSNIPEKLRDNLNFKKIDKDLENLEKQTKQGRDLSELSNAERKQLDNISEFKKKLVTMDEKQIERTAELLGEFKKGRTLGDAIDQLATLHKLEGKFLESTLLDMSGNPIRENMDDIIKNMDFDKLRRCKGRGLGISDDAIESLAKTFEAIHANTTLKFSENIDEIFKAVKSLMTLAKAT